MRLSAIAITVLIMLVSSVSAGPVSTADVTRFVAKYIDALKERRFDDAAGFWHPALIETAERLGIEYRGIEYKYDCMSPLTENLDILASPVTRIDQSLTHSGPASFKSIVTIKTPEDTLSCEYFVMEDSTGLNLIPRFWRYLNNLRLVKTKYYNVFYRDDSQLNDIALEDLDTYTETTIRKLGGTDEDLAILEEQRMEYYLARNENEVSELLGFRSHGLYFRPSDIIITYYMPHYHQIALFALSFVHDDMGLVLAPFMQAGTGCMFGGRFGQDRSVMPQIAAFTLENELYKLDDVLTFTGLYDTIANIDFSYPLSLGVIESIYKNHGLDALNKLYSQLSGTINEVKSWDLNHIAEVLEDVTGSSLEDIKKNAASQIVDSRFTVLRVEDVPDSGETVFQSGMARYVLNIKVLDGWYNVKVAGYSGETDFAGTITVRGTTGKRFGAFRSFLWRDHFPEMGYRNELYSIQFTPQEIGIYEYFTNRLIAKYVGGFHGRMNIIENNTLQFRFREDLFEDRMDRLECRLIDQTTAITGNR